MSVLRHAWRNLWRNRKRTAISLAGISLGGATLIIFYALVKGTTVPMVETATRMAVGEVQVHAPGFLGDRSLYKTIKEPERILSAAKAQGLDAVPRALGFALLSNGPQSAGATIWGVDPATERVAVDLPRHLSSGAFLPDARGWNVVLGKKLAGILGAAVGTELVVVVQGADGSLGNEVLKVAGILDTIGEGVDRGVALIDRRDFDELFSQAGKVHEIALTSHGRLTAEAVAASISAAAAGEDVKTWKGILPALAGLVDFAEVANDFISSLFFLAAALGVLNTMLMASFERIPEFGLLKALGATPARIVRDVAAEAAVLGLISSAVGAAIGIPVSLFMHRHGIDLAAFGVPAVSVSGIVMESMWYAELTPECVYKPLILMWVVCCVASLYPAIRAARLDPVKALTHV